MGWGGIKNLPPGFDVFDGKRPPPNIVDEAIAGRIPEIVAGREQIFVDLKRNLLHQDFLRYFDSCLGCARVLLDIENGKHAAAVQKDIIEPALANALEQLESIKADVVRSRTAKRPLQYDPLPSMSELTRRSLPIARAYPHAAGAADFEARTAAMIVEVQSLVAGSPR